MKTPLTPRTAWLIPMTPVEASSRLRTAVKSGSVVPGGDLPHDCERSAETAWRPELPRDPVPRRQDVGRELHRTKGRCRSDAYRPGEVVGPEAARSVSRGNPRPLTPCHRKS